MKKIKKFSDLVKLNESMLGDASKLFGKLFQSRDILHLNHLNTKSNAAHLAMNEYYDEILDLIDALVETYQGIYGLVEIEIPASKTNEYDTVRYLQNLYKDLKDSEEILFSENQELIAFLQDIENLINSTLYKLKNLNQ